MPSRLADLQIRRIAVHEVFVRDNDLQPVPPRFSESLALLSADGLAAIRERLIKALGSDSKSIEMTIREDGPASTFQLCASLLDADDERFLELSKRIAQKLAGAQVSRKIPGGVVVVMDGTTGIDAHPFTCIIKAEVHSGFAREAGEAGILIRFLDNLLLTPQQKLHKIGLFIRVSEDASPDGSFLGDDFSAYIFDNQMISSEITTAANYFYEQFLGCTAASSARKLTRDFYNTSRAFLDASPLSDEQKVESVSALHVYLRSNRQHVHAMEFAQEYLPPELHQEFSDYLTERAFPEIAVPKDLSAIKRRLRIRKLSFTSDVRIIGPADRFNELVAVQSTDDGVTVVRIVGNVATQE